jgi:uncharacterized membrane protein
MNSHEITKIFITSLLFIIIDSSYLTLISPYFKQLIYNIQGKELSINVPPTLLCYISLVFGLYYFIIKDNRSYVDAGILGLVIYSVFEFTNKALFNNWPWYIVVMDTLWGGILFSLTTYLVYRIYGTK